MFTKPWGRRQTASRYEVLSQFWREAAETEFPQDDRSPGLLGQSGALIRIERLVDRVVGTTQLPFLIESNTSGQWVVKQTPLGRRLREVLPFSSQFSPHYIYSEQATAFLQACWLIGNVYGIDVGQLPPPTVALGLREAEVLNDVVVRIRMSAYEPWYTRASYDRGWEARKRAQTVAEYTADILRYYARTMVVRLDLGYVKEARGSLTIDQVYAHLDRLRYLVDCHPMFDALVGYAWHIEQGERDGYHLHCIFFFDGSKECRDVYKGFEIGGLWQNDITGGAGHYENCNAHKERYPRLGIGMIHRDNAEQCLTAIEVLQYVAKDDGQHLRMKPYGRRIFGTGQAPDLHKKRGRPAAEPTWTDSWRND